MNDTFETRMIPLDQIVLPNELLREVEVDTQEFLSFEDSIKRVGVLQPVIVRTIAPDRFELVSGAHRLHACKRLKHTEIPAVIRAMTDIEALAIRVMENAARLDAKPVEYARQLYRIMTLDPELTQAALAKMIGRSLSWVDCKLNLLRLEKSIQKKVERGFIPVSIAYEMSKMPEPVQLSFVNEAMTMKVTDFREIVTPKMRELQCNYGKSSEKKRASKQEGLRPFMRSIKAVQTELKNKSDGAALLAACKAKTPLDGWMLALEWVINMDPITKKERTKKHKSKPRQTNDFEFHT